MTDMLRTLHGLSIMPRISSIVKFTYTSHSVASMSRCAPFCCGLELSFAKTNEQNDGNKSAAEATGPFLASAGRFGCAWSDCFNFFVRIELIAMGKGFSKDGSASRKSDKYSLSQRQLQTVPKSIKRLSWIRELDLSYNKISDLPNEFCAQIH